MAPIKAKFLKFDVTDGCHIGKCVFILGFNSATDGPISAKQCNSGSVKAIF